MYREPQITIIFVSTLYDKNKLTEVWQFANLAYFVILWRHQWRFECVILSFYTNKHPQLYTCKILLLWHQSFITKSSGQISWQAQKATGWKLRQCLMVKIFTHDIQRHASYWQCHAIFSDIDIAKSFARSFLPCSVVTQCSAIARHKTL